MVSVIGLSKCPKCGFKEIYGCNNYYTTGAPFKCHKCKTMMDYAPYQYSDGHVSEKQYNKTKTLLESHLETLDFEFKKDEKISYRYKLIWKGV